MDQTTIAAVLAEAGCVAPEAEAGELLRAAGRDPARLQELVSRRRRGEPLAWLVGEVRFCGLRVAVAPGVYVPRPQTEAMARRAASLLPGHGIAVDLCTGSGAVAVVLAHAVPTVRVVATEIEPVAAACARGNGVEVFEGPLDEPLPAELRGSVDVLTAVVPYVPTEELGLLPRDVRAFEPALALDGGPGGTVLLEEVARRSVRWLRPGGHLVLELGGEQAGPVGEHLRELGFTEIEVISDAEGQARAICGRLG